MNNLPVRRLILASSSPRRQQLLRDAHFEFEIDPADIDESNVPKNLLPSEVAIYLAKAKGEVVAARHPEDVVLAADTIVAFGDQMIGKPKDAADARKILELLSGTTNIAITGVSVVCKANNFIRNPRVMSAVKMRMLTPHQIERYIESGLWEGKAGGYGVQDSHSLVAWTVGDMTNVVGLPMKLTTELLGEAGVHPSARPDSSSE
jgi:septum formation protein